MSQLGPIFVIAAKDVAQRSRDRSAYIMGIAGPLLLVFILNGTLGAIDDVSAFEFGVVDDDGGAAGSGFTNMLSTLEDEEVVALTVAEDRADLERLVDGGDVSAGFLLPSGLSEAVETGAPAEITIVGDPGASIAVDVAQAITDTFVNELDYVSLATGSVLAAEGAGIDTQRMEELAASAQALEPPVALVPVETEGRGSDPASYFAVSLSVFFLFFTVQFGVLSLMEEREAGTLSRILVTPTSPAAVVIGKMASSLVIGVLSMGVLVVATTLIVGATWGDPLAVGVLVLVGVVVAIAFATVVAAVAQTAEQAGAYASMVALVFGLLGGSFFQISQAPGPLAAASYLSPHRWLLDGFRDISYGAGIGDLGPTLAVLGAFIVVVGGAGLATARRGLMQA